jgi:ribosomal-protein-alanine N-acetyltransferase
MKSTLVLEAAEEADLEALAGLERRTFSHPWTLHAFRQALGDPEHGRVLVLRTPLEAALPERGIRAYCVFQVILDEMQIHNFAVHPEHRGRGVGRWLLRTTLEIGARRGARSAFLEVRQSNWSALHLYRSVGFQTVSVRRDYYSRPREDALVLRKDNLEISGSAC